MPNENYTPHRTIAMPVTRAKQITMAAAYLSVSGEGFIQAAISAALLELCARDKVFAVLLMRTAGVDWETIEQAEHSNVLSKISPS